MKFFVYDQVNENVVINEPELLLIKEFAALFDEKRNKTTTDKTGKKKERALKEIKFIYLFFDWSSPYFYFAEMDRYKESMTDAGLTHLEMEDPVFREACRKYDSIQSSHPVLGMLKSALLVAEKLKNYLDNLNLEERDIVTGKPIFKAKDVIAELRGCKDIIDTIKTLEKSFKRDEETETRLRGDRTAGMFD